MKQNIFGLCAIVFAMAISSFSRPQFNTEKFRFTGSDPNSETQIEDVTNWVRVASQDCPTNVDDKVCEIVVDEQYYTGSGASAELNAEDPDGSGSNQQMLISASPPHCFIIRIFGIEIEICFRFVDSTGTTGTPKNKDLISE